MKAEGNCPDCGGKLGVQVQDSVVELMKDTIEQMVDKDGNKIRCTNCEEYVEPQGVEVHTEF
jgi:transcription initiation factor IIE alpha subunit